MSNFFESALASGVASAVATPADEPARPAHTGPREQLTLDEPVYTTLWRDLRRVFTKIGHALVPRFFGGKGVDTMRDWDLWGPLLLCLWLGGTLAYLSASHAEVFTAVFVIVWVGSFSLTLNAKLLGGKISFFQGACVLGYCVAPLCIASTAIVIASLFSFTNVIFRVVMSVACALWGIAASYTFMAELIPSDRRVLGTYPLILFFAVLAWMTCQSTPHSVPTPAPTPK